MPDEKNTNGKNGKSTGLVERITTGVKEDLESLKLDLPSKAKEQVEILKAPTKTQVYTSIFRHKHDDTPRNRARASPRSATSTRPRSKWASGA